jgi:hypothetical protein
MGRLKVKSILRFWYLFKAAFNSFKRLFIVFRRSISRSISRSELVVIIGAIVKCWEIVNKILDSLEDNGRQ